MLNYLKNTNIFYNLVAIIDAIAAQIFILDSPQVILVDGYTLNFSPGDNEDNSRDPTETPQPTQEQSTPNEQPESEHEPQSGDNSSDSDESWYEYLDDEEYKKVKSESGITSQERYILHNRADHRAVVEAFTEEGRPEQEIKDVEVRGFLNEELLKHGNHVYHSDSGQAIPDLELQETMEFEREMSREREEREKVNRNDNDNDDEGPEGSSSGPSGPSAPTEPTGPTEPTEGGGVSSKITTESNLSNSRSNSTIDFILELQDLEMPSYMDPEDL